MRTPHAPRLPTGPILGALALAAAGLASLWAQARLLPVPTRSIAELHAGTPLGYVRVHGTIPEPPRWDAEGPRLRFRLTDGTADLVVSASGPVAAELQRRGRIPRTADNVTVEGRVWEDSEILTLELPSADAVRIERPEPLPLPLGALSTVPVGTRVQIAGQIRSIRRPYVGLTLLRLQDETGAVDVAWYEALVAQRPELPLGAGLRITGALTLYREAIQVALDDPAGWAWIPWDPKPRPIAEAQDLPDGAWTGVEGTLRHRLEDRWVLADGTGEIEVRLSPRLQAALSETPPVGARLRAWGQLRQRNGEPAIFPELSLDLRWETPTAPPHPSPSPTAPPTPPPSPAPTPSPTPQPRPTATPFPLSELARQPLGALLTVEGTIVDLRGTSAGWLLVLEQGGAQARMFIPNDQMAHVPAREGLYLGAVIRATGVLTQYQGTLELLPRRGRDIMVRKGVRPDAPLRAIGSLGPGDQGARVRIVGEIVEAERFSTGLRLKVRDESGALPVILWENVAAMIPERLKEPGARVDLIGQVRLYRGEQQLIPTVPWEVRAP